MTTDARAETARAARGRWIWTASAAITVAVVVAALMTATHLRKRFTFGSGGPWLSTSVQTVTFRQPVNALDLHDYGGPVEVSAGRAGEAQVTEIVHYNGSWPRPEQSVSNRQLTIADPACLKGRCSIAFRVTVPAGTMARLESDGGSIDVTGLAGPVTADSGGGPVIARSVAGGLYARTAGGTLTVHDESGRLTADTGGGPADAEGISAADVMVTTAGGAATLGLMAVPRHVWADSGGGPVMVQVPVGSYAVSADSGGGPREIGVTTDPASPDTISVSSGGGLVSIR